MQFVVVTDDNKISFDCKILIHKNLLNQFILVEIAIVLFVVTG